MQNRHLECLARAGMRHDVVRLAKGKEKGDSEVQKKKRYAQTEIRTRDISATTKGTNHYTIHADSCEILGYLKTGNWMKRL